MLTFALREPRRGASDASTLDSGRTDRDEPAPMRPVEALRAAFAIGTIRRLCYAVPFIAAKGAAGGLLTLYFAEVFVLGPEARGVLLGVYGAVGLVGLVVAAPLSDRLLAERPASFLPLAGGLLAVQAVALVVLAVSSNLALSVVASVPVATVDVIFAPAFLALISQVVPARVRGLGLQVTAPFQLLGAALAVLIVGGFGPGGLHSGIALFAVPTAIAAVILGSGANAVARDVRTARASAAITEAVAADPGAPAFCLSLRGVEAGYSDVPVLFGIDLDVETGEIVALVGTNGAGKSTLLRVLAGLLPLDAGAMRFEGRDIAPLPAHERSHLGVRLVSGGAATFPGLRVDEHLRLASPDGDVNAALVAFPALRVRLERRAGDLSGGEQQQLALACALLGRPRLLLVDELSLGLAPAVVEGLLAALRDLRDAGTTIILVEQSLNVALQIAERAVFLERGEVRFDGPTRDLLDRPDLVRATIMGAHRGGRRLASRRDVIGPDSGVATPALAASGLTLSYGGITALDAVDLDVVAGQVTGIIGPNGAGKTTLFDVLSGFATPDAGAIRLSGVDITHLSPDERGRRGLARSFQSARLFPSLSVRENVLVAFERRTARNPLLAAVWAPQVRRSEAALARRADGLLELLGVEDRSDEVAGSLSTGTRRVVDVACALAADPAVLLLDEPSSGLAQAEVETLGGLLLRIVRETGAALVVVEHDLPLITSISDQLVAMDLGKVIATGHPDEVVRDPAVLASYLSASDAVLSRSGAGSPASVAHSSTQKDH